MRDTQAFVSLTSEGCAVASSWSDILLRVDDPAIVLACWSRKMTADVSRAFDAWPVADIPNVSLVTDTGNLAVQIRNVLASCRQVPPLAHSVLLSDLKLLGQLFSRAAGLTRFEIRIEAVNDNACEKFHTDNVTARLLTTYRGPGTQWVPHVHGEEALCGQDAYRGPLYELPRFAVALARGSARGGRSLVHRSPPIEGKGVTRLLVAMNEPLHSHDDDCSCRAPGGGLNYRK
jgi:hypothetical protein